MTSVTMLKLVSTVTLDLIGDGRTDVLKFSLRQMRTPPPMTEGVLPTGLGEVKLTGSSGGRVTGQLDGDMLTLVFDVPPSAAKLSIDFLYGPHN